MQIHISGLYHFLQQNTPLQWQDHTSLPTVTTPLPQHSPSCLNPICPQNQHASSSNLHKCCHQGHKPYQHLEFIFAFSLPPPKPLQHGQWAFFGQAAFLKFFLCLAPMPVLNASKRISSGRERKSVIKQCQWMKVLLDILV